MHQVLPDLTSQVTAGPAADPAAFAIAEGTAGANPGAPAAAADEPPDAHYQAPQYEQGAQHRADNHADASGICGERERPVRLSAAQPYPAGQEAPGQVTGKEGQGPASQGPRTPSEDNGRSCYGLGLHLLPGLPAALGTNDNGKAEPAGAPKHSPDPPSLLAPGPLPPYLPDTFTSTTHTL